MTLARTHATTPQRKIGVVFALLFIVTAAVLVPSAISAPGDVEQRVEAILSKMSLEQKIDMLGGQDDFYIRAYPDLGLPRLRMADGPIGVRHGGPATTMAGGISLAASWDPALAAEEGTQIARDARAKGVHFMLGPAFNIYRAPMNGRNFEYMGEDPYLAGQIAVGKARVSARPRNTSWETIPISTVTTWIPSLTSAPCAKSIYRHSKPP